jgi:hypothetical protein
MGATTAPGWRWAFSRLRYSGESRTTGCESWHASQPLPSPRCNREVHKLPREGTFDASHQIAPVLLDRRRQAETEGAEQQLRLVVPRAVCGLSEPRHHSEQPASSRRPDDRIPPMQYGG